MLDRSKKEKKKKDGGRATATAVERPLVYAEAKAGSDRLSGRSAVCIDAELENKPWYHGLLTRDDCASLLTKKGDFVVRSSIVNNDTKIVVSVHWERPGIKDPILHFIVMRTSLFQFYLHEGRTFMSVAELIDAHISEKITMSKTSDAIIVNPVVRAEWELDHDQITLEEKIGQGAFGEVWKGHVQFKTGQKAVAIKSCTGNGSKKEERMAFMKEARIMRQYQHPNVIRIFGVAAQKEPLYIVMELAPGGSLLSYLKKTPGLGQREMVRLILEVARGMEYLEIRQCIHRDLAARNCLLGKDKDVKICDFGLSSVAKSEQVAGGMRLPIKWTAPEALHECKFSSKSDVWSWGILVTEVWSGGAEPYPGKATAEVKKGVLEGLRSALPESMPQSVKDLLGRCWATDPHTRPSFNAIRVYVSKL